MLEPVGIDFTMFFFVIYSMHIFCYQRCGLGLRACSYILYNTLFSTLGIDFVIGDVDGKIEPVGIEVDSHDCTINCQLFEFMNPHTQGNAVKPYVETMIARSQKFSMQGRTVVVI